jgi:Acetoacetate decarboxylase (ADC)
MTLPAHAPWRLQGSAVVAFTRRPGAADGPGGVADGLPEGLRPLPGPSLLVACSFPDSPVGPYVELSVASPARLGLRPGLCLTTAVVNRPDARVGGVVNWGFPKELGTLSWSLLAEEDGVRVAWDERAVVVTAVPRRRSGLLSLFSLPVLVPLRAVQRRADGPVVVPGRLRGWARPSWVTISTPAGDPLALLAGRRRGFYLAGVRLVIDPARHPSGLTSTLRAPLRAPEPALSGPGRLVAASSAAAAGRVGAPRAYSSAG